MRRTSTGSEAFFLFICLEDIKFSLLTFFSLLKTIYPRVLTKPLPNDAKRPLPVDVRRSKTSLLKFPNSRAHKGLSALAYSLRTKYAAATSILVTAHDLLPIDFVAQSDRMLVELIQRTGLQSKPGSKTFSSIPGLSYIPF